MKRLIIILCTAAGAIIVAGFKQTENSALKDFAKMIQGTWELTSRISHGKPSDTKGIICFNLTGDNTQYSGEQLATESGILASGVSPSGNDQAYAIAALFKISVAESKAHSILYKAEGEITGTYDPFRNSVPMTQEYRFIKKGNSFVLADTKQSGNAPGVSNEEIMAQTGVYDNIVLTHNLLIFHSSSLKLTDTYKKISSETSRIGGLWSLKTTYNLFKENKELSQ